MLMIICYIPNVFFIFFGGGGIHWEKCAGMFYVVELYVVKNSVISINITYTVSLG